MSCDDTAFWQARLDKAKTQVILYEDAIDALVVQGVESYTLDTGQSRQTVTKRNLKSLQAQVDTLMNRIATLQARIGGCGSTLGAPTSGC